MNDTTSSGLTFLQDIGRVAKELWKESERGCVLVATAFIDDLLELLLKTHFRRNTGNTTKLLERGQPLSTLSSRIQLAYQLELIDGSRRSALDALRRIRNDYAHLHVPVEFDSDRMQHFIDSTQNTESTDSTALQSLWKELGVEESAKTTFIGCVISQSAAISIAVDATDKRAFDQLRSIRSAEEGRGET